MRSVHFWAAGHNNIVGRHDTTLEITTERGVTRRGTCIVGVCANQTLRNLDDDIKAMARNGNTKIVLRMTVDNMTEEVVGRGGIGLTYTDAASMVARTSSFECGRTVLIQANKAASGLDRRFVDRLKRPDTVLDCELVYISG